MIRIFASRIGKNHCCFDDSRDSKNDSIGGARREMHRHRRYAPSQHGRTRTPKQWARNAIDPESCRESGAVESRPIRKEIRSWGGKPLARRRRLPMDGDYCSPFSCLFASWAVEAQEAKRRGQDSNLR